MREGRPILMLSPFHRMVLNLLIFIIGGGHDKSGPTGSMEETNAPLSLHGEIIHWWQNIARPANVAYKPRYIACAHSN